MMDSPPFREGLGVGLPPARGTSDPPVRVCVPFERRYRAARDGRVTFGNDIPKVGRLFR
jgi:hypothetical protein